MPQVHNITQKYMNALFTYLHIRADVIFYEKIETYVRGLESVGQTENTYGPLLVPIILKKLPGTYA